MCFYLGMRGCGVCPCSICGLWQQEAERTAFGAQQIRPLRISARTDVLKLFPGPPKSFPFGFKLFVHSLFVCLFGVTLVIKPGLTPDLLGSFCLN